jgi:hypothetical protein
MQAMIYLAADQTIGVPRAQYMTDILSAAKFWQFPDEYIGELAQWSPADG